MIQTVSTVMQLFKGSYFSVAAGLRHLWPNSAIASRTTYVKMFHLLQSEVQKITVFKGLQMKR